MMLNVEKYSQSYQSSQDLSPERLPEPIRREHFRTKEDLTLIANAMKVLRTNPPMIRRLIILFR